MSAFRTVTGIFVIAVTLTACRIRVPNEKEQQVLVQQGAFPSGVPAWVVAGQGSNQRYSGLIPSNYTTKSSEKMATAQSEPTPTPQPKQVGGGVEPTSPTESATSQQQQKVASPIARIERFCPGTSSQVVDAITTEEENARVQKLSALAFRCKNSDDLWFWLGKDQLTQGNLADAKVSLERALAINPENMEARGLLNRLAEQNTPGSKSR